MGTKFNQKTETKMGIDWIQLVQTLGGIVGGIGLGMFTKSGRIKAKSDAYDAMATAYEERITALHTIIANNDKTEIEHSQRISELNHALTDKTERIRKLTDDVYESQTELNRANERITHLTEERDNERIKKEYYKRWRCEKSVCRDPEGRIPPNSKLVSENFKSPE